MPCVGYRVEAVVRNSSSTIYELFRSLQPILTGDIHPSILLAETLHPSTYREQLAKVYNEEFIDHQLLVDMVSHNKSNFRLKSI